MQQLFAQCPAKINLFLHITGRRADGYHLLESIFCPVNLCDELYLTLTERSDSQLHIHRSGDLLGIPEEHDLTVKACKAYFARFIAHPGLDVGIQVLKRIPAQAGLGGGSSNAAWVLRLLNQAFPQAVSRETLLDCALRLGADVPFFMQDESAYIEGIGEQITPIFGLNAWLLIYKPPENCPTGEIFSSDQLTRDSSPVRIAVFDSGSFAGGEKTQVEPGFWSFLAQHTQNSMQTVVEHKLPSWQAGFEEFKRHTSGFQAQLVRMSGSGSAYFAAFSSAVQAEQAHQSLVNAGFHQKGLLFESQIGSSG